MNNLPLRFLAEEIEEGLKVLGVNVNFISIILEENPENFKHLLSQSIAIFIIDLNFEVRKIRYSRKYAGYPLIERLQEEYLPHERTIIVHSGYPKQKGNALKRGVDLFLTKGGGKSTKKNAKYAIFEINKFCNLHKKYYIIDSKTQIEIFRDFVNDMDLFNSYLLNSNSSHKYFDFSFEVIPQLKLDFVPETEEVYLAKKIIQFKENLNSLEELWIIGLRSFKINFNDSHEDKTGMNPSGMILTLQVNIKKKIISKIKIRSENHKSFAALHLEDLGQIKRTLENAGDKLEKIPFDLRKYFNLFIACRAIEEFVKERRRQEIDVMALLRKLDYIGQLECQKQLYLYYIKKNYSLDEIHLRLDPWVKIGYPKIIQLFKGRLSEIDEDQNLGYVELENLMDSGDRYAEPFDLDILNSCGIYHVASRFIYAAVQLNSGRYIGEIEPVDFH